MKAIQFNSTGNPVDVLQLRDIAVRDPGKGECRIKVLTSNINPSDILFIKGQYGVIPKLPATAGIEGVGLVECVGEGALLKPGQKVIFTSQGVWQEQIIISESKLIPVPVETPNEIGCQIMVNPLTANRMLQISGLTAGQWLLLTAGNSAVCKFAVQLCRIKGINTISTVRRNEISVHLKELGANQIVNTEKENLIRRAREVTQYKGVDFVFDAVGGKLGSDALRSLRSGGEMIVYGAMDKDPIQVSGGEMIFRKWKISSFWRTPWMDSLDPQARMEAVHPLLDLFDVGKLTADIEAVYPLEDVSQAIEHVLTSGRMGKILLQIGTE